MHCKWFRRILTEHLMRLFLALQILTKQLVIFIANLTLIELFLSRKHSIMCLIVWYLKSWNRVILSMTAYDQPNRLVSEQNHVWPDNVTSACPSVISSPVSQWYDRFQAKNWQVKVICVTNMVRAFVIISDWWP